MSILRLSLFVPILLAALGGCAKSTVSNSASPAADNRPKSYREAVARIKECRDSVEQAFAAGTPNECDEALHEAADVLDMLPNIAASDGMSEDDQQAIAVTSKELFDVFAEIHRGFHGSGEGAEFDDVVERMDEQMAALESKMSAAAEEVPE